MADISPLSPESREALAMIDELRSRGATEVSVDGVYARFGVAPAAAEPTSHESPGLGVDPVTVETLRRLDGLLNRE